MKSANGRNVWKLVVVAAVCLLLAAAFTAGARTDDVRSPQPLAIGANAPDFCLPGIDGKTHCLADYTASKILIIVFTCNHCPTAQLYEGRIKQLAADYRERGVALVAIEPNSPRAVRLDELGYTDVSDSLEEMKIRAAYRNFTFPYLYDGETQSATTAYGPSATPHVFIFDAGRKLRYQGRVDNNPREPLVTVRDARNALDALLAGKEVAVAKTPSVGCSTKWLYKEESRKQALAAIESKPVDVKLVTAEELKALRKNETGKMVLVNFWATWCAPCVQEMPELQTMYRMYGRRAFDLVTVSINYPDEKQGVLKRLNELHATTRNFMLGSTDIYPLLGAFDSEWNAAVPYTMLILPGGEVAYKKQAPVDPLELKRAILRNMPDDDYIGQQAYWKTGAAK